MNTELAVSRDRQILNYMREVMEIHTNKLESVEGRLTQVELSIEQDIFINTRQAATLQAAGRVRVGELLKGTGEYAKLSRRYFPALWHELKARFGVPSYREIPRKEFKAAMKMVSDWFPVRPIS